MSDSESEIYTAVNAATLLYMMLLRNNKKKVKKRRLWCRRWIQRREEGRGALYLLNNELLVEDPSSYTNFLRLNSDLFKTLLSLVEADISRQDTCMRESISARSRLQVTLRYLATGESFRSLMYLSRIHESTISRFIPEVCEAIYRRLKHTYLKVPQNKVQYCDVQPDAIARNQLPQVFVQRGNRNSVDARQIRDEFKLFFNTTGARAWQEALVAQNNM
ncbi:hypothetical protein QE152_g9795 [Popillia japonica]|uniref:Nuclease HARBI1 n=1 Tax=Popillia japonica TaxID=7064 RepID=A0AAW1LWS4_POPJA